MQRYVNAVIFTLKPSYPVSIEEASEITVLYYAAILVVLILALAF
jgi:hypothetical protein